MTNILLQTLNAADLAALEPHLRITSLERDAVLASPGDEIEKVYFPHSGIVSFMVGLDDGSMVQTLMVGADGVIGAAQALDNKTSVNKIVVQVARSASVIHRDHLRRVAQERPHVRNLFATHEQFVVADIQQTAACNARHSVEQRCARWLMRMRDLVGNELQITQEALADMIGVRRTSVSKLAMMLQDIGALRYQRGTITVVDAERLTSSACECHQSVRNNYETLFGRPWPRFDPREVKRFKPSSSARSGSPSDDAPQ